MKKISVIVPVYKVEKYIDICVNSLVNQTYKNLEIILVDDGSPDNCPAICDKWAKKDNRIKVIHKENGGLSDARNKGLEIATGDYIGFVDSDDVVSTEMYQILANIIEPNEADMAICSAAFFNEDTIPKYFYDDDVEILYNNIDILNCLLSDKISNHIWNKLYKKELFEDIRFPKGMTYEDIYVLYKLILKSNKFVITNSKLYGYLQREDGITGKPFLATIKDYMNAINTRYEALKLNDKLIYNLNISKAKAVYTMHVRVALIKDIDYYNSEELIKEYKFLKKVIKLNNIKEYLTGVNIKVGMLKIILLLNRKLFWKIMTRK